MLRWLKVVVFTLLLFHACGQVGSETADPRDGELQQLREQVAMLERLVKALQSELFSLKRNDAATSTKPQLTGTQQEGEEEKRELEKELERELRTQPPKTAPTAPSYGAIVFGGGMWQALNPDTSVIANFQTAFRGRRPFASFAGSEFSEAELAFQATTDPFPRLDTFIAIGPNGAEVEEATLSVLDPTFLRLPRSLQIRLGLLRAPFGQLNNIHPPEQPFVDTPLVHRLWFGHKRGGGHEPENQESESEAEIPTEGSFTGTGLSLSWMLLTGKHLTWLTVAPLNVDNSVFRSDAGSPVWLARVRHMRELSLTQSLNLGLNYAFGRNDLGKDTRLLGVDVTYRWRR